MFGSSFNYLRNSGALGLGALLVGLRLLVVGAVMIYGRSTCPRFVVILVLALLPVALGATGAAVGDAAVDRALASGDHATAQQVDKAREIAASALEIGCTLTGVLLAVGLIGLLLAGDFRRADGTSPAR